jgi:hypothetical protein
MCEIGQSVDTARWGEVAKLDEEAAEYSEALADLCTAAWWTTIWLSHLLPVRARDAIMTER